MYIKMLTVRLVYIKMLTVRLVYIKMLTVEAKRTQSCIKAELSLLSLLTYTPG